MLGYILRYLGTLRLPQGDKGLFYAWDFWNWGQFAGAFSFVLERHGPFRLGETDADLTIVYALFRFGIVYYLGVSWKVRLKETVSYPGGQVDGWSSSKVTTACIITTYGALKL